MAEKNKSIFKKRRIQNNDLGYKPHNALAKHIKSAKKIPIAIKNLVFIN